MLDYDKLFNALLAEARNNRDAIPTGEDYNSSIWTARMAANHVLISLATALSKARQ